MGGNDVIRYGIDLSYHVASFPSWGFSLECPDVRSVDVFSSLDMTTFDRTVADEVL